MAHRWYSLDVIATMLVQKNKNKRETSLEDLTLLLCIICYRFVRQHGRLITWLILFTLPFILVVGDHVFAQEQILLPLGLAWKFIMAAVKSPNFLPGITRSHARQHSPDDYSIIFPGDRVWDEEKIRLGKQLKRVFFLINDPFLNHYKIVQKYIYILEMQCAYWPKWK